MVLEAIWQLRGVKKEYYIYSLRACGVCARDDVVAIASAARAGRSGRPLRTS